MIKEYVVGGSPQQVNINSKQQNNIKDWQGSGKGYSYVIEYMKEAQGEIYTLMARDNFPRFTKAQPFADLLVWIGSYATTDAMAFVSESDLTMLVQDGEGGGELAKAHLSA